MPNRLDYQPVELVYVNGLLHVLDGIGVEGPLEFGAAVGGHHDAGYLRVPFEDAGYEPIPVQAGHLQVRDQGDDLVLLQDAQGLLAVGGDEVADLVGVMLQAVLQGFEEGGVVIN